LLKRLVKRYGIYTIYDVTDFLTSQNFEVRHREKSREAVLKNYSLMFQKQ
jgi:hypothetical protein